MLRLRLSRPITTSIAYPAEVLCTEKLFSLLPGSPDTSSACSSSTSRFDNIIDPTADILELYEGAFFNPARPSHHRGKATSDHSDTSRILLGRTDSAGQFFQFERSVFRLDRLLNQRHSKTNSMPLQSELNLDNSSLESNDPDEVKSWLDTVLTKGETARLEERVTAVKKFKLSDVIRKSLLITEEEAKQAEDEILEELKSFKTTKQPIKTSIEPPATVTFNGPYLLLDAESLKLIDTALLHQIVTLMTGSSAEPKRQNLERSYKKQLEGKLEQNCIDLFDCRLVPSVSSYQEIQAVIKPQKKKVQKPKESSSTTDTIEGGGCWLKEDEQTLCSYVELYQRRKQKINQAALEWLQSLGHAGSINPELTDGNSGMWNLVAAQLKGKRTPAACKNRWLKLQRTMFC